MSSRTVVVAIQENHSTDGKISRFDDAADAARFIEDLLAAGFDGHSIRVVAVQDLSVVVTRRPVVSLVRTDWVSRVKAPAPEPTHSEVDLVSVASNADAEPVWAPTGDGAVVTAGDRPFGAVSLN